MNCNSTEITTWTWIDRSIVNFRSWSYGQPDGPHRCARMLSNSGQWFSASCTDEYSIICEREALMREIETTEGPFETTSQFIHVYGGNDNEGSKNSGK